MAQVDAFRFLANLQQLFAPSISDNQEFVAYIDGSSNSFVIQGDNLIHASTGENTNLNPEEISALSRQITSLQSQTDSVENFCRNISAFQTQITTLSGGTEGLPVFEWASIQAKIDEMNSDISTFGAITNETKNSLKSYDPSDLFKQFNSEILVEISALRSQVEELRNTVENLSSEVHSQIVSENEIDVS